MYYEVIIRPASGGFGMWDTTRSDEPWHDEHDIIQHIYTSSAYEEVYTLGDDALPAYVEDIRGHVRNEPPLILALVTTQHGEKAVQYLGIVASDD